MRIGFVSQALPYLPSRGGFRLYGGNLIRVLSRRHEIDLVSLMQDDDEQHVDWAKPYCSSITTFPTKRRNAPLRFASFASSYLWGRPIHHRKQIAAVLQDGLLARKWDVLHIEGPYAGGLVPEQLPVAKVLSLHDSWTLRCDEMLQCAHNLREKLDFSLMRIHEQRFERLVYPRFESCVVVADRDAQAVRETAPEANVAMIPYGTDSEYFHPVQVPKEEATLVFHSHLGYAPNIEAALEFANQIFPLILREVPNAVFQLVGAAPGPKIQALASRRGIRLSADLPDLRPAVCSARIYVCAIRYGTGLKSKMLEAMAMRMPIVAYHPGSTVGIDCVYGKHLLAAETSQQFAAHVLDLLRNPSKADQLAQAARELVEGKYSWDSSARAFEDLYQQVIMLRRSRTSGAH